MDESIAVVHGNYFAHGGGEVVAEELAQMFDAPLYYGFGHEEALPDNDVEHIGLFEDRVASYGKDSVFFRDLYYAWAWQHVPELHEYDVIIQSGNEPGWYVPPDQQVIIKYVHSTPRAAYDRFPDKGDSTLVRFYAFATRVLYLPNIPFPDRYVANSELIKRRLDRYWDIADAEVVYPPVDVRTYEPKGTEDFYLTFSRLDPAKRIDEIVRAFASLPEKRLIVGGTGPEEERLKKLATKNVDFYGFLSEQEKRDLLGRTKALVFAAANEDFGMVPVEALASGTPVIGVREGYTQYQVRDGENGILYDRGVENLVAAIERFEKEGVALSPREIEEEANKYSSETFRDNMRTVVREAVDDVTISNTD